MRQDRTSIYVGSELLAAARLLNLNISAIAKDAIREAIKGRLNELESEMERIKEVVSGDEHWTSVDDSRVTDRRDKYNGI